MYDIFFTKTRETLRLLRPFSIRLPLAVHRLQPIAVVIDDVARHLAFGLQRILLGLCARNDSHFVCVVAEAGTIVAQRVEHDKIEVLSFQLVLCVSYLVVRLKSKAYESLVRLLHLS